MEPNVDREIILEVPAEDVWAALADPAQLGAWLGAEVEVDLRPGGAATFRFDDGEVRRGMVHEVADGAELSFAWWPVAGTDVGGRTTVTMTVERHGEGGARLRIREALPTRARAAA
jgi:uncharacterized protein YndB with AHSA1/START domain